jgi:hypothetical protein
MLFSPKRTAKIGISGEFTMGGETFNINRLQLQLMGLMNGLQLQLMGLMNSLQLQLEVHESPPWGFSPKATGVSGLKPDLIAVAESST